MATLANDEVPRQAVKALKARLRRVKLHLQPILDKPLNEIYTKLPIAERYELQVVLTYALNSLYYIYMRTQGTDPQKQDVMNELARVQEYIKKLKKLQGKEEKPKLVLDKEAAGRFIKAAITGDKGLAEQEDKEKKRKLQDSDSSSSEEEEEEEDKSDKSSKQKKSHFSSKKSKKSKKSTNKK